MLNIVDKLFGSSRSRLLKSYNKTVEIINKLEPTIKSLSDYSIVIDSQMSNMEPNDFYIKAAFALSPLPIFFVDKLEEIGITLPEYITKWRKSIIK